MGRIISYRGEVSSTIFSGVRALVAFDGRERAELAIANTRVYTAPEARRGFEQIKRWVSTGAFRTIALADLSSVLEEKGGEHFKEWLTDHSDEPDFPTIILFDDQKSLPSLPRLETVETPEGLKDSL